MSKLRHAPTDEISIICSVLEQPMKIPFVAATALFAYKSKPELGTELINKAATTLQKNIDSGSWREVKLLVRFLGCLQPLFEGEGIFPLLEELFARAVDLQTTSSEDVRFFPNRGHSNDLF